MSGALVINTCGSEGVVALVDRAGVIAFETMPGRGTSEALMPAVRRLLAGVDGGLEAIGVVEGPGSFTGVRVGLSTAKGLCEGFGIGMVAMSRLALVADGGASVVALLDAGRGEFFSGVYADGELLREALIGEAEAKSMVAEHVAVTCEAEVMRLEGVRFVDEPGAEQMRQMMYARIDAGAWSDIATADGNYLRRTDAERLRER